MEAARYPDRGRQVFPFEGKIDVAAVPEAEGHAVGHRRDDRVHGCTQHEFGRRQNIQEIIDYGRRADDVRPQDRGTAG